VEASAVFLQHLWISEGERVWVYESEGRGYENRIERIRRMYRRIL
jgi:hypothetical protein